MLIQQQSYTPKAKQQMLDHLRTLGLLRTDTAKFAVLRRIRGSFIKRTCQQHRDRRHPGGTTGSAGPTS